MATKRTKTQTKKAAPAAAKPAAAKKTTKAAQDPEQNQTQAKAAPARKGRTNNSAHPAVGEEAGISVAKETSVPEVKEEAKAPAVREAAVPEVKAEAKAPAVREAAVLEVKAEAKAPAVREDAAASASSQAAGAEARHPKAKAGHAGSATATILLKPHKDGSKITPVVPRPVGQGNPYMPMVCTVAEVIRETPNIKTIRVTIDDEEAARSFCYEPGQVGQLSVFGAGESTFVINSPPSMKDYLQFSVMMAGEVTTAIHSLTRGDKVGVRAPLGRPFPYELWKGKNLFFIGGGIGMAPIRTIMLHCLERKDDYGRISLLYGGRTPQDLTYSYELDNWMARPDLDCTLTIDREAEGWPYRVGLIPDVLRELHPSPDNCVAVLCGPPVMIKFTLMALDELGFPHENVYTTLEKRMKCGIGICGRCGIGGKYVCLDGPVFSQKELDELPPEL